MSKRITPLSHNKAIKSGSDRVPTSHKGWPRRAGFASLKERRTGEKHVGEHYKIET